jgi:hypothetical protein
MTDAKICHKTLGTEITEFNTIVAYGAPCMKEKCIAWVDQCGKADREGFNDADRCRCNCEFNSPHCRCLE